MSYNGGTATVIDPGATNLPGTSNGPQPYSLGADNYYSGGGGTTWESVEQPDHTFVNSTGSVECQGDITATFTWQATNFEAPPSKVVVAEDGSISVTSRGYNSSSAATTATCSAIVDFPSISNTDGRPVSKGCSAGGVRYKIVSQPGASFTVTCSASASLAGTGGAGSHGGGTASVRYRASAAPLEIVASGGIGPQNDKKYLIGQQVSATVATGGLTASGFNWSVSGGEPFKDWTADQSESIFTPLGTETGSQTDFHFKKEGNGTLTTPVHLSVPTGALPANGLDTTLTRECSVQAPTYSFEAEMGYVQVYNNPMPPVWMRLWGANRVKPDGTSAREGCLWISSVLTPAIFGAGGVWNYTQLATPHRVRRLNGVMQKRANNDILALDTQFPYAPDFGLYPDDGSTQYDGDSPGETWGEDAGTSYIEASDTYATYMLYRPPGNGSCYVPLAKTGWYWKGKAKPDSNATWAVSDTDAGFSSYVDFPPHPSWSSTAAVGSSGWVNQ